MVVKEMALEVEETDVPDDEEALNIRYDIMSYPADYTLQVLYEKLTSEQIIVPDFQRNFVWSQTQASRLIESFLLGLPIPQVFLYRDRSAPTLTVIDGQQRLGSIAHFYKGELRLKGVDSRWLGRSYKELNDYDRSFLDDSTLRAIVIRQIQPDDDSGIYQIFSRLNTGGTQLNDMEIRRAVSISRSAMDSRKGAVKFLDGLNDNPDWRALIGTRDPAPRFRDVELILRILALARNWRNYGEGQFGGQSMKNFMDKHMEFLDRTDNLTLEELGQEFQTACNTILSQLGKKPFHLRGRLNLGALDSIMACAVELGASLKPNLAGEYSSLQNNEGFIAAVTHNTSHALEVKKRFTLVHSSFRSG